MATLQQEGDFEAGIVYKYHLKVIMCFLNFIAVN